MDDRLYSARSYETVAEFWLEESKRDPKDPDNEFYASMALRNTLVAKRLCQEVAEEAHKRWMDKQQSRLDKAKDLAWITLFVSAALLVIYAVIRLAI